MAPSRRELLILDAVAFVFRVGFLAFHTLMVYGGEILLTRVPGLPPLLANHPLQRHTAPHGVHQVSAPAMFLVLQPQRFGTEVKCRFVKAQTNLTHLVV